MGDIKMSSGRLNERFSGMVITLKKRVPCILKDDTKDHDFLVFEHYDGVDIEYINEWYGMRPKGTDGSEVDPSIVAKGDDYWDKYILKLYFPREEKIREYDQKNFYYNTWKKIAKREAAESKDIMDIKERCPFLSMSLINLSSECVKLGNSLTEMLQDNIRIAAEKRKIQLSELNCVVMPSIGYADFVVLFLSRNPALAMGIMDDLRVQKTSGDKNASSIVSSSYSILGFAKEGLNSLQQIAEEGLTKAVRISLRMVLREGVSVGGLKQDFMKNFTSRIRNKRDNEEMKTESLFHLYGNSDCLYLSDMDFCESIPLFYDGKMLNPSSEFFQKYIQETMTSVRINVASTDKLDIQKKDDSLLEEERGKFEESITDLGQCLLEHQYSNRLVNGLQMTIKMYLNLIQFSRSFDMQAIIHEAFEALYDNIKKTVKICKKDHEYGDEWIQDLMDACEIFCEKIGDYLADMQRSDRLFIEEQSLFHPSICSAAKLLFFYNQFTNIIAKNLVNSEQQNKGDEYCFIIVSGGCDKTEALDVFSYMSPWEAENHSLIIITMPEMSLYDLRGSCFRILHEVLHFCAERRRFERRDYYIKDFAKLLSKNLLMIYLFANLYGWWEEDGKEDIVYLMKEDEREEINEFVIKTISDELEKKEDDIKKKIAEFLESSIAEKRDLKDIYGRNVYNNLSNMIKNEFLRFGDDDADQQPFDVFLYLMLAECEEQIAYRIENHFSTKYELPFSAANILRSTAIAKIKKFEEEGSIDLYEMRIIHSILRRFSLGESFHSEDLDIDIEDGVTVDDIEFNLSAIYKECYADCLAAKILNLTPSEFLLSFVYESWNLDQALPNTPMQCMRVGLEMEELYGIHERLGDGIRRQIMELEEYLKLCGFNYERNDGWTTEMLDRIDGQMEEYSTSYAADIVFAKKYIKECYELYDDIYGKEEWREIMKICELFQKNDGKYFEQNDFYEILKEIRLCWKAMVRE